MANTNYLLDTDFLSQLDLAQEKEIYVKIISLTLDEEPLQEISGKATGGSISIDGKSAVRRTCSLTMTTDEININSFYWGLHTKFKLFLGLKNKINSKYPDIIWFPEGTFVITNFTTNQQVKNYTINISGKDKMCYLNGEVGGVVTALTHNFGTEDYTDEYGVTTNTSRNIKDIITDAVHEFAHEPLSNIIINDLDDYGIELLEYRGEQPLYFLVDAITGDVQTAALKFPSDTFSKANFTNQNIEQYQEIISTLQKIEKAPREELEALPELQSLNAQVLQNNLLQLNNMNTMPEDGDDETATIWEYIIKKVEDYEYETQVEKIKDILNPTLKSSFTSTVVTKQNETLVNLGTAASQALTTDTEEQDKQNHLNRLDDITNYNTVYKKYYNQIKAKLDDFKNTNNNYLSDAGYEIAANEYLEQMSSAMGQYLLGEVSTNEYEQLKNSVIKNVTAELQSYATLSYIEEMSVKSLYDEFKSKTTKGRAVVGTMEKSDKVNFGPWMKKRAQETSDIIKNYLQNGVTPTIGEPAVDDGGFYDNYIDFENDKNFVFNPLFELDLGDAGGAINPTVITDGTNYYTVAKAEYGQTAGYRLTNLTYAGDLIINAGASVTSMLDKIVQMLGDFEYFYDINGHFVFQRKKTYINTSWNSQINNQEESYIDNAAYTSAIQYSFEDSKLITAFANNPALANVKNDYSIWGTRKGVTGTDIPVHLRYAIDTKPITYTTFDNITYTTLDKNSYISHAEETEEEVLTYKKKQNPNGLPEQWWELLDWANLYKFIYGVYPTKIIKEYATIGKIKVNDYFESVNGREYSEMSCDNIILKDGKFYNTHGSCTHLLSWWQDQFANDPELEVYIHAPNIPGVLVNGEFDEDYTGVIVNTSNVRFNQDWRELIYQMAKDYRAHNKETGFATTLYNNNPSYVKNGLTGYESYYVDLEGFWRQLYNPDYVGTFEAENVSSKTYDSNKYYYMRPVMKQCDKNSIFNKDITYYTQFTVNRNKGSNWETGHPDRFYLYLTGNSSTGYVSDFQYLGSNNKVYDIQGNLVPNNTDFDITTDEGKSAVYYTYVYQYNEVKNLSRVEFYKNPTKYWYGTTDMEYCFCGWEDYQSNHFSKYKSNIKSKPNGYIQPTYNKNITYCIKTKEEFNSKTAWKTGLVEYPETLNFWFDFLESGTSELGKYSVTAIGNRPKSANDNTVKAIYFRETPTVIFMSADEAELYNQVKSGYTYVQLPENMQNLFTISAQGKSAKDVLDSWLYQYGQCTESVTITAIPVYYLQPNTRILVRDQVTKINGEYIINRITLPLTAKGTMSITAEKAVERIY